MHAYLKWVLSVKSTLQFLWARMWYYARALRIKADQIMWSWWLLMSWHQLGTKPSWSITLTPLWLHCVMYYLTQHTWHTWSKYDIFLLILFLPFWRRYFQLIFLSENCCILIKISLKCVPEGLIAQSGAKMRKINRPWPKSNKFWRWSGYIAIPNFRPFLVCILKKISRNLLGLMGDRKVS